MQYNINKSVIHSKVIYVVHYKSPARTCDELDETVLTFAEVKALAIGDNRIKEKLEAENERDRILVMKNAFKA